MKFKLFLFSIASMISFLGYLYINKVSPNLTHDDFTAFSKVENYLSCNKLNNFDDEIRCIDSVQNAVLSVDYLDVCPTYDCCVPKGNSIEPLDFYKRGYGCCFERSRFNEKLLNSLGFKTRHVFIIESKGISLMNFIPLNQSSHAASEVLTSKGWMGLDSITNLKLIDEDMNVFTYKQALQNSKMIEKLTPKYLFDRNPDIIYGMYSRHGYSFSPNIPGPEFALKELKYNFGF